MAGLPGNKPVAMLATDLPGNKLELPGVVLDGAPSLHRLALSSLADHPLQVALQSDLGRMLSFQSANPNLESVEAQQPINELFNSINLIETVQLPARGLLPIVLQFAPQRGDAELLGDQRKKGSVRTVEGETRDQDQQLHRAFAVHGRLQFIASGPDGSRSKLSISLNASVCMSVIKMDVNHLLFENLTPGGGAQVREFRVVNCSEVPVEFMVSQRRGHCITPARKDPTMEFTHYESGEVLVSDQIQQLAGFAQLGIRVTYTPHEVGEFKQEILLRNLSGNQPIEIIHVHADVTQERAAGRSDVLQVTAANAKNEVLNWGEGHVEQPLFQTVSLRNVSGDPILVQMSSDRSTEVSFHHADDSWTPRPARRPRSAEPEALTEPLAQRGLRANGISRQPSMESAPGGFSRPPSVDSGGNSGRQTSRGSSVDQDDSTDRDEAESFADAHEIEEVLLLPGKSSSIVVKYVPAADANSTELATSARTFRITFRFRLVRSNDELIEQQAGHLQARKGFSQSLKCRAKVCKTIVEVSPPQLLLGDCMLGQSKTGVVLLHNRSDMQTEVCVRHDSKVLFLSHESVALGPQQSKEVSVVFAPTQKEGVNYFNKEIEFRNLNNREDVHVVHVRASVKNPDKSTVHSLFYKVTPRRISFGCTNINSATPCSVKIRNMSSSPIKIGISSSLPEELQVFVPNRCLHMIESDQAELSKNYNRKQESARLTEKRQMLIQMVENRDVSARSVNKDDVSVADDDSPVLSTPGTEKKLMIRRQQSYDEPITKDLKGVWGAEYEELPAQPGPIDLSHLIECVRAPLEWYWGNPSGEKEYVQEVVAQRKLLEEALSTMCSPLQAPVLLNPNSELELVLLLTAKKTPINIDAGTERYGQLQLLQASLFVQLLEFDHSLYSLEDKQKGSTQSILVEAKVCSTVIDLAQKSIHFGSVDVNSRQEVAISIGNLSDVPLLYRFVKSGSFASSSLGFPRGSTGIVRAFGSVDVPLTFCPHLDGEFHETITIESVLAPSEGSQTIAIKAFVRPKSTFWLEALQLPCGPVRLNKGRTAPCRIVLTNTSRQRRMFRIDHADTTPANGMQCDVAFWLEHDGGAFDRAKAEDRIELLERELKISIRKGKKEKRDKIQEQIVALQQRQLWEGGLDAELQSDSEDESNPKDGEKKPKQRSQDNGFDEPAKADKLQSGPQAGSITFAVNANSCQTILMAVKIGSTEEGSPNKVLGQLRAFETRNNDDMRFISFDVDVCPDEHSLKSAREMATQNILASPSAFKGSPDLICASPTAMLPQALLKPPEEMERFALTPVLPVLPDNQLIVSPQCIELGDVIVGSRARASFNVANPESNQTVSFTIIKAVLGADVLEAEVLNFTPESGQIEPGEYVSISVICSPNVPGGQMHEAVVRSRSIQAEQRQDCFDQVICFSMMATYRDYLAFPSIHNHTLDIGVVHIQPQDETDSTGPAQADSKVVTFQVKSMTHRPVLITAATNMKREAFVYSDAQLECEVVKLKLLAYKGTTLYFLLRPASQRKSSGRKGFPELNDRYAAGECREIVGGIHFDVYSETGSSLGQTALKFTSLIGCSKLLVEPDRIDLQSPWSPGATVEAKLQLRNSNSRIALPFEIVTTGKVVVDTPRGKLAGTASEGSSMQVICSMQVEELGLQQEHITITNLNIPGSLGRKLVIPVSLFVDDGTMHTSVPSRPVSEMGSPVHHTRQASEDPVEAQLDLADVSADPHTPAPLLPKLHATPSSEDEDLDGSRLINFGMLYLNSTGEPVEQCAEHNLSLSVHLNESAFSTLLLQPMSDLGGLRVFPAVQATAAQTAHAMLHSPSQTRIDSAYGLLSCGDPIMAGVGNVTELTAELHLGAIDPDLLLKAKGNILTFDKQLVFYSIALKRVLKVMRVCGTICMSLAELAAPSVKLGSIGYVSRYSDTPFEIAIRNTSAAPLNYRLEEPIPDGIIVSQSDIARVVPAHQSHIVNGMVRTSEGQHEHGQVTWKLAVLNENNAANRLEFCVHATVSACVLQYEGLSTSPHDSTTGSMPSLVGQDELPSLKLGVLWNAEGQAVFEEQMVMRNMLGDALDVILHLRQPDDAIATLQLLSAEHCEADKLEHLSSSRVELGADEEVELHVRAQLGPGGAAELFGELPSPRHPGEKKPSDDELVVLLGELHITPVGHEVEVIPVFAYLCDERQTLTSTSSWTVSTRFMHTILPPAGSSSVEKFVVLNSSPSNTMEIEVSLDDGLVEQWWPGLQLSISPQLFSVLPGKSQVVLVELVRPADQLLPEDSSSHSIVILVSNAQEPQASSKQIELTINTQEDDQELETELAPDETTSLEQPRTTPLELSSNSPRIVGAESVPCAMATCLPVIELRGCTPLDEVGRHYSLNIGQRSCQDGTIQWELTLNMLLDPSVQPAEQTRLRWSMTSANPSSDQWLSLSADGGELSSHEETLLVLSFDTEYVGVYTTHMILTNHSNPSDIKVVKVTLDVASYKPTSEGGKEYFDVLLPGKSPSQNEIAIPLATPGNTYTEYSFSLCNRSDLLLLFFITSDIEAQNSASELSFSLSQNSLRQFKSIEINPRSHQRIYLHYTPHLAPGTTSAHELINISVNCRQIKDYRKSITLSSYIQPSWVAIPDRELWLHCPPPSKSESSEWPPVNGDEYIYSCQVPVQNSSLQTAYFTVKSAMHFCTVSAVDAVGNEQSGEMSVSPGQTVLLTVNLNSLALAQCRKLFHRQRFLEEHFWLYNSRGVYEVGSCESSQVVVRLSIAPTLVRKVMRVAVFDVGSKNFHASMILEARLVKFLQAYNLFWCQVASGLQGADKLQQLRAVAKQIQSDPTHAALFVEFSFLIDEIIFYGIKGAASGGQTHLFINHLSHLLFSATLASGTPFNALLCQFHWNQEALPAAVAAWVHKLSFTVGRLPSQLCQPGSSLLRLFSGLQFECDISGLSLYQPTNSGSP